MEWKPEKYKKVKIYEVQYRLYNKCNLPIWLDRSDRGSEFGALLEGANLDEYKII